jgi:uncharacterized membrane protein YfcA
MPEVNLLLLVLLFFATSIVGVVTGSNSLITVPVMFQFGIDEKVAVATNMFGLTFMAIGGTIPFVRKGTIRLRTLSPLVILTLIGSAIGATLVGIVSSGAIRIIVSIAMISIVLFTIFRRDRNVAELEIPGRIDNDDRGDSSSLRSFSWVTLIATFLLAIYGGLYSGGYVTVLTAVLITFSGMTFVESVGATKLINVFSSGIATLIFMWQRLVDYRLGIILAIAMFAGAFVGAHFAVKMNEIWLKRIFLTTVFLLAVKTLVDFL